MWGEAEPEPAAHVQVSHVSGEEGGQRVGEPEAGAQAPVHSPDGDPGFLSLFPFDSSCARCNSRNTPPA